MHQSDFTSRTATSGRPKVFLADLEYAKKEELERRRKLRLKQVRQQARDIASIIRNQASHAKKKREEQNKSALYESAVKSSENRKAELQQKLSECLTSVGTGHSSAAMMTEVDELLQHKIELQDTLARVRAELAAEKAKETWKPRQEISECLREGFTISKVRNVKPTIRLPNVRKLSPSKTSARITTPPNLIRMTASRLETEEPPGDRDNGIIQLPSVNTIFSPPMLPRKRSDKNRKLNWSPTDGRKSCPPITDTTDSLDSSADSDDSGQTWPPVSVRKKKNSKVRMYDHSAKKCSEYVQQCGVIRMETPKTNNMKDLIIEEEELLSRKAEGEMESRQIELQRGLKAIREEMAKQDFDTAIRDLCLGNKERRFRKARNYQPPAVTESSQNEEQHGSGHNTNKHNQGVSQVLKDGQSSQHRPPVTVSSKPLQSIVSKFAEQREAILHERSNSNDDSAGTEDSEDESTSLPLWIRTELNAQNKDEKDVPDRVPTPETLMANMNNIQRGREEPEKENQNMSSDLSSFIRHEQEFEGSESTKVSPKQVNSNRSSQPTSQDDQSSSNGTNVSRSSSSAGINVQIKIKRDKTPVKRLSFQTPNKETETSSSYYSPPERLSPQQISVLSDILSKMSVKNRNPVLHHYISRMLEMSRQSLSDLEVSVCSDFSVQSEVIRQSKVSSPKCKSSCNGVTSKQEANYSRNRVCLQELDNFSTAGTVCSSPRTNSIGNVPAPNHSGKIAGLLRSIIDLQRIYSMHSSLSPSSVHLSESHSSYQSVPGGMNAKNYHDVAPLAGSGLNFCEDTGIFLNGNTSQDDNHQTLTSLLNGHCFNIPSQLFPNPFAKPGEENVVQGQLSTFPDLNTLIDVPYGYSRRPERDPSSIYVTRRDSNKVINTLSDIESAVSSIQNTPTKKSPACSDPSDDKSSVLSDFSSREFISSQEMLNNDLIKSTSTSSDFEDVFRSLGLGWALSTLRRTRTSKNLRAEDSSSKSGSLESSERTKTGTGYHHSTPLKDPNSIAAQKSPELDPVPSLSPPNITLHCPNWRK